MLLIIVALVFIAGLANFFADDYGWEAWSSWLAAAGIALGLGDIGWVLVNYGIDRQPEAGSIEVKYRSDRVPVGSDRFDALGLQGDSTVKNAWYDSSEKYLVT